MGSCEVITTAFEHHGFADLAPQATGLVKQLSAATPVGHT